MNREEALKVGASYYMPEKPCHRGHISERKTQSRICRECHRLDAIKYRRRKGIEGKEIPIKHLVTGEEYSSMGEAAERLNVNASFISLMTYRNEETRPKNLCLFIRNK